MIVDLWGDISFGIASLDGPPFPMLIPYHRLFNSDDEFIESLNMTLYATQFKFKLNLSKRTILA